MTKFPYSVIFEEIKKKDGTSKREWVFHKDPIKNILRIFLRDMWFFVEFRTIKGEPATVKNE